MITTLNRSAAARPKKVARPICQCSFLHLLLALALPSHTFAGDDFAGKWYAAAGGGVVLGVDSENAQDGSLFSAALGRRMTRTSMLELELTLEKLDAGNQISDIDQQSVFVNYVTINPVPLWNPFFLIGIGLLDNDRVTRDEASIAANVGIGGIWTLVEGGAMLRADARLRYDFAGTRSDSSNSSGEGLISATLLVPF